MTTAGWRTIEKIRIDTAVALLCARKPTIPTVQVSADTSVMVSTRTAIIALLLIPAAGRTQRRHGRRTRPNGLTDRRSLRRHGVSGSNASGIATVCE